MIDISIIIPVYNSEKYISECLESIVNQTIINKEVIIVNDGSTDSSRDIIDEYIKKYDFMTLINKENEGVALARNLALNHARGKYIGFVDSDDIIDKNMFKEMVDIGKNNRCDIVECNYQIFKDKSECNFNYVDNEEIKLYGDDPFKMFLSLNINGYLCTKIYKAEKLKSNLIKFPNTKCFEDMMFNMENFSLCKNYCKTEKSFYKYRQIENSLSSNINENHIEIYSEEIKRWKSYLYRSNNLKNKEIYKYVKIFEIKTFLNLLTWFYKIYNNKDNDYKVKKNKYIKGNEPKLKIKDIYILNYLSKGLKIIYLSYKLNCLNLVFRILEIREKLYENKCNSSYI